MAASAAPVSRGSRLGLLSSSFGRRSCKNGCGLMLQTHSLSIRLLQECSVFQKILVCWMDVSPVPSAEHEIRICRVLPNAMQLQRTCPLHKHLLHMLRSYI